MDFNSGEKYPINSKLADGDPTPELKFESEKFEMDKDLERALRQIVALAYGDQRFAIENEAQIVALSKVGAEMYDYFYNIDPNALVSGGEEAYIQKFKKQISTIIGKPMNSALTPEDDLKAFRSISGTLKGTINSMKAIENPRDN